MNTPMTLSAQHTIAYELDAPDAKLGVGRNDNSSLANEEWDGKNGGFP